MDKNPKAEVLQPSEDLPPRIKRQRDYYFLDEKREFQNELIAFTTGIPNDFIEPGLQMAFGMADPLQTAFDYSAIDLGVQAMASKLDLPENFWDQPLIVRRALIFQATLKQIPVDILPDELIVGARWQTAMSAGLNEKEAEEFRKKHHKLLDGGRKYLKIGLSSANASCGHVVVNHKTVLQNGLKGVKEEAEKRLEETWAPEKKDFYRAIIITCDAACDFAHRYAEEARELAKEEEDPKRKEELIKIAENCDWVPYDSPRTYWEALQAIWFNHMLIMISENYPGPGTSFGRLDQILYPFYKKDVEEGKLTKEWAKELFQSFCVKPNYSYDKSSIGPGGRHAWDGQLWTVGGCGPNGEDQTNELTYLLLDAFFEINMLEPKLNVRTHSGSPKKLLMKLADITRNSQGAPFIINFDKAVIEALEIDGVTHEEATDYAPIGCMENSIRGSQAGTVDIHFSQVKPLEFVLNRGKDFLTGKQITFDTGDPADFKSFDEVMDAYKKQLLASMKLMIEQECDAWVLRGKHMPTPFLSIFIKGCMGDGKDVKSGGGRYNPTTFNGLGIATVADALAAIKKVVFDDKKATMKELVEACQTNWEGKEELRKLCLSAPKFGNDDDYVDSIARDIMTFWALEVKKHITPTGKRFRAGYLSWNHFVYDGGYTMATPDGRKLGDHLSNAVGPHQGRDFKGPTAAIKSIGKLNLVLVPSGGSYTWTINPATMKTDEKLEKFVGLMRAYNELGGTAWQTNCISPDTLRDAQKHPENYQNLLVRITGYNAYFVTIGRGLQDEIIARTEHSVG